jgi:DNA-binding response OmpR family regulator
MVMTARLLALGKRDGGRALQPDGALVAAKTRPRILVVDEDSGTRTELQNLLADAGYHVAATARFVDATKALMTGAPDLLITELRLGAFNGLHLVMRGRGSRPEMRTIVLTRFPDRVLESEAQRLGAAYVVKPADPQNLLSIVAQTAPIQDERRSSPRRAVERVNVTVADRDATLRDVSYEGFKIDLYGDDIPASFELTLPARRLLMKAAAVWTRRPSETSELQRCGAALADLDASATLAWRNFVDSLDRTSGGRDFVPPAKTRCR